MCSDPHLAAARLCLMPLTPEDLRRCLTAPQTVLRQHDVQCDRLFGDSWIEQSRRKAIYRAKLSWGTENPTRWLFSTTWWMVDRDSRRLIGEIGFKGPPERLQTIEIGYHTRKPFRRNGYMTEALTALCKFAFSQVDFPINTVFALTERRNTPSHRVLQSCGFVRVPTPGRLWRWEKTMDN